MGLRGFRWIAPNGTFHVHISQGADALYRWGIVDSDEVTRAVAPVHDSFMTADECKNNAHAFVVGIGGTVEDYV